MKGPFAFIKSKLMGKLRYYLWETEVEEIRGRLKSCGKNLYIETPVVLNGAENITIADNVSIGAFVHMWGQAGIDIGSRVMIASGTSITSLSHDPEEPDMYSTHTEGRIVIEDDVWIGTRVVILPGVKIGRGAVVGAGAVVTRDVAPDAIVFGAPARLHRYRNLPKAGESR